MHRLRNTYFYRDVNACNREDGRHVSIETKSRRWKSFKQQCVLLSIICSDR